MNAVKNTAANMLNCSIAGSSHCYFVAGTGHPYSLSGPKGQLISKCFLVSSILPKNERKQFKFSYHMVVKSNFSSVFLGELKIPKKLTDL